ncbi:MAG: methionine--tRNA ligase [Rickettsiales bacterium]
MTSRFISTPIYYVNDAPHIGHAYTTVAADAMARFWRLDGDAVFFLTGCDEHGQKVARAAEAKNMPTQNFVDGVAERFRRLVAGGENVLNVTNDDFIRTTEERHKTSAQALWKRLEERGHIYKGSYAGWYAVRDEAFYDASELVSGKAPTGADVDWVEEESYFFRLSSMQDALLKLYEERPDFVRPASRLNEVAAFVRGGKEKKEGALKDLSISRTACTWGVPVPGDASHVMYVWVDALANYLSALGFPDESAPNYQKFWRGGDRTHVVGKDILRFHAVYWPAMLMAADIPLPHRVVAHGWWTVEGEKMSKSLGNVVSPDDLAEKYGQERARYFLLREMPFGNDGNFSSERVAELANAELSNKIGNLAQRSLSMIAKNDEGALPMPGIDPAANALLAQCYALPDAMREAMRDFAFHKAIGEIIALANAANEYFDAAAPWALRKTDPAGAGAVLYVAAECVRCIAVALLPFAPVGAGALLDALNVPESARGLSAIRAERALTPGEKIEVPKAAFPRLS